MGVSVKFGPVLVCDCPSNSSTSTSLEGEKGDSKSLSQSFNS